MKDILTAFDAKASLLSAQFGAGAVGTYTSNFSYDTAGGAVSTAAQGVTTAGAGIPNAQGPGGNPPGTGGIGGPLLHDFGRGRSLLFTAQITTTVTSAGAATLQVNFIQADDATLTTNAVATLFSGVIPKATLVAGYRFPHKRTPGKISQRWIGAQVVIGTAALTAGAYSADLALDIDDHADVYGA